MKKRFAVIVLGLLAGASVAFGDGGMFLRRRFSAKKPRSV